MKVVEIEQTPTVLGTLQTEYRKTLFYPKILKLIRLLRSGHSLCLQQRKIWFAYLFCLIQFRIDSLVYFSIKKMMPN